MSEILQVSNLDKTFRSANRTLKVLDSVSFSLDSGSTCAIVGPSGSGKTTLLGICAGLDLPTSGKIILNDIPIFERNEDERAQIRNDFVGFIFQTFQLIPTLTALENVMVPMELRGHVNVKKEAQTWLERVGLGDRLDHYPSQLSGGEQQRVAIARAFITNPIMLFADEPTGNLDMETGTLIEELLFELNKETGTTLLLVTHNLDLARKCGRIIQIRGGKIASDELMNHESPSTPLSKN